MKKMLSNLEMRLLKLSFCAPLGKIAGEITQTKTLNPSCPSSQGGGGTGILPTHVYQFVYKLYKRVHFFLL